MKLIAKMIVALGAAAAISACGKGTSKTEENDFHYLIDQFADLKVMRFQVPGWDDLTLRQKEYVYHLSRLPSTAGT